jgi:hypothetical protein
MSRGQGQDNIRTEMCTQLAASSCGTTLYGRMELSYLRV